MNWPKNANVIDKMYSDSDINGFCSTTNKIEAEFFQRIMPRKKEKTYFITC